jgi:polysaccharide export outer membrane protein
MYRIKTMNALGLAVLLMMASPSLRGQQNKAVSAVVSRISAPAAGNSDPSDDQPVLQQRNPRYRVQRDDVLVISFALSPELNQTATIQPDGYISLQAVGSIYVQGLTIPQIVETIKKAYSPDVLHDPIVDVTLSDFQKPFFLALGQVGKPGQYDLRYDTTVSGAIAIAGGFTPDAKTQVFLFRRTSADLVEVKKLSLKDILHGKNVNEDARLQPGDMIFVPEKFITGFKKYVPYTTGLFLNPGSSLF